MNKQDEQTLISLLKNVEELYAFVFSNYSIYSTKENDRNIAEKVFAELTPMAQDAGYLLEKLENNNAVAHK